MKIGDCSLCLSKSVPLQLSHFMPRSLYPLFRAGNLHPVRFSAKKLQQTSNQVKDYVFCRECEKAFNAGGESWLHALFAKFNGPFPLRERLLKQTPIEDLGETKLYAVAHNPEIDGPQLTHFGCGIFFKAAVHPWHGDPLRNYISMEPDEVDVLRNYLLGKADLPETVALGVTVDAAPVVLQQMIEPYRIAPVLELKRYLAYVPGIAFQLFVGDGAQEKVGTSINSRPDELVLYENVSLTMRNTSRLVLRDAERPQKLLDMIADLEKKGLNVCLDD